MTNSNQKGKRGEREAAALLRKLGFEARRSQQYAGGVDSSDVTCESLPNVHIEVKYGYDRSAIDVGTAGLRKACLQAIRDGGGKPWIVLWRPMRACWRATFMASPCVCTVAGEEEIKRVLQWLNGRGA